MHKLYLNAINNHNRMATSGGLVYSPFGFGPGDPGLDQVIRVCRHLVLSPSSDSDRDVR